MIVILVPIFSHLMTVFVVAVAISVPIADLSRAVIVAVVIVSAAVVSVMVIPLLPYDAIIPEARIVPETRFILPSPFPIFPLAFTIEPVVFHIVVPALGKPFPVVRIVVSVVAAGAAIGVWVVLIPMLRASGGQNRSRSQS